jgi:hypothetical protein
MVGVRYFFARFNRKFSKDQPQQIAESGQMINQVQRNKRSKQFCHVPMKLIDEQKKRIVS